MKKIAALPIVVVFALAGCGSGETTETTVDEEAAISVADMTEVYGCGTGFWIGNPEQTLALRLQYQGSGKPAMSVTLPDPGWDARVIEGENLYANWCDDVLEPNEPTPVETNTYEITAGNLQLEGAIPEPFEGGSLTVHATGLQMTGPDGAAIELGDVSITNDMYGFFAG